MPRSSRWLASGQVISAALEVATALDYDAESALEEETITDRTPAGHRNNG